MALSELSFTLEQEKGQRFFEAALPENRGLAGFGEEAREGSGNISPTKARLSEAVCAAKVFTLESYFEG